jgi:demethylmenaquinone methyltransferase/2-methoxy-6-polyprenyl-1,4-benzoquinol methylase
MSDQHQNRIDWVKDLFSRIADRYDRFNHMASLGRDLFWRRAAAKRVKLFHWNRVLDIAAGTGDLTMAVGREKTGVSVIGIDFTLPMLKKAQVKLKRQKDTLRVQLLAADAMKLPFPEMAFDSAVVGFGIRNMPHRLQVLKEIKRILHPGGRVIIAELCFPRDRLFFKVLYRVYLKILIPFIGRMIAGDIKIFQYLSESINDFPPPQDFMKIMHKAGLTHIGYQELTFGVCILFWGEKPTL